MFRAATVPVEILALVGGFDMQVNLDQGILDVDPCVEEGDLCGALGRSKFNGGVVTVKTLNEGT